MLQIKTFTVDNSHMLDDLINDFLGTLKSEAVKNIYVRETGFAVVQYEIKDIWEDRLCSECQYWDDSGTSDAVVGLCQEKGCRKRFNCRACERFKDIRG